MPAESADFLNSLFSGTNPVFSGGFGLAVLAMGAQVMRSGSQVAVRMMRRHLLSTLEVTSKDKSYPWVLSWITTRTTNNQHLSVSTQVAKNATSGNQAMNFEFLPGPGQHLMRFRSHYMLVQRFRETQQLDFSTGKPWEKIQFTLIGRDTSVFANLLAEAFELAAVKEEGKTVVYTNWGSEWRPFGQPRSKRPLQSVILDTGVTQRLLQDACEWRDCAQWYRERGIPYRRGYLLHGPPGSGKSSFIMALAGELGYSICILNLSERGLTDDRLALAMNTVPPQSIVLLEDVDAAFPSREVSSVSADANTNSSSDVTFSGLLNVLDGVSSSEDRLVFMTTNYMERLDPALIRPGRVDVVQYIGDASLSQVQTLYSRFYPESTSEQAQQFALSVQRYLPKVSMATLQGHLLCYKEQAVAAIEAVPQLATSIEKSSSSSDVEASNSSSSSKVARKKLPRQLTVEEVDRMYFNPQEGWDKGIKEI